MLSLFFTLSAAFLSFSYATAHDSNATAAAMPLVSVLMASFNRDLYLDLAIQSVRNQTYPNWELVIVDDASSNPETIRTLIHWQQADQRIRVLLEPSHAGVSAARNRGFQTTRGDLVALMDDDDLMRPQRLASQLQEFLKDPTLAVVHSGMDLIDERGRVYGVFQQPSEDPEWFKLQMLLQNFVGHPSAMVNKRAIEEEPLYDYITTEDWYLWIKLLRQGLKFRYVPERLVQYRAH